MHRLVALIIALALPAPAWAQQPVRADSTARDTTRVTQLPEVKVTVTRTTEPLTRAPFATGVLDRDAIQRGQQTVGIDEALNNIPGVVVSNRYNFSLDQRISIRGFGSRSNFGVRGLKILLDGIPQTLPDGQSQLTNIEFADIERAEVLKGASSSLYGNASGGVIAFETERAAPGPFAQRVRVQAGSGERDGDAFYKWQSWTSARSGSVSGTLSVSQFKADGFRQHSAGEFRQLNTGVDYAISGSTLGTLRLSLANDPEAQNPGALTKPEYDANPEFGGRQQHCPRRRQGCPAVPARPRDAPLRHRRERVRGERVRRAPRSGQSARGAAGHQPGPDRRHLRGHRPGGRRDQAQRQPAARPVADLAPAVRGSRHPAYAGRPAELRLQRRPADRRRLPRPDARRSPSSVRSRSCSGVRSSRCC